MKTTSQTPSASGRPGRSLASTLTDLYRSRGLLLGLLSVAVGIILIVAAPDDTITVTPGPGGQLVVGGQRGFLSRLQLADVGAAIFQAGLTITLFQVLLNQVAEDRFVEQVREALSERERAVQHAVVGSLAAGERLRDLKLAPDELDRFQFGYRTNNVKKTRFAFRIARWQDEYDKYLRDPASGAVWRLPSSGEFDEEWASGFTLHSLTFSGRPVGFQRNDAEREYVGAVPVDEFEDRSDVFVQYSFTAKVLADGNLLSFEVPRPTFSATYSVSIAVDDIERIRALDYFGSTRPASVEYSPSLEATRFVGVSVDDWILPKAGMVVIWKRRGGALPAAAGTPPPRLP